MGSKKTTTQEMPAFQQEFLEGTVIPFAQDFLAQDFQPYTGERVAGMTPLQQQAMTSYGALSMGQPLYGQAAQAYGQMAQMDAPSKLSMKRIGVSSKWSCQRPKMSETK